LSRLSILAIVSAIAGGLLVTVCAVRREPERAPRPPFPPPTGASVARSAPDAGPKTELAEERYAPLLLRPGFEDVVRALDDRDNARAAALVADRLAKAAPPAAEAASYGYLSALLFERAGQAERALRAYESATAPG
jgi:hypothetical protein